MFDFAQARRNMIDCQIHTAGISNPEILEAFAAIPREIFVPEDMQKVCYIDGAFALGAGRCLLEPSVHARMLEAMMPSRRDRALDIGGGTGYAAAVLSCLVAEVHALEEPQFLDYARQAWNQIGLANALPMPGHPGQAFDTPYSYDLIMLNGTVARIPENITDKLAIGGRLAAVVRETPDSCGAAVLVMKGKDGGLSTVRLFEAGGMPYLPGFEPESAFAF